MIRSHEAYKRREFIQGKYVGRLRVKVPDISNLYLWKTSEINRELYHCSMLKKGKVEKIMIKNLGKEIKKRFKKEKKESNLKSFSYF